MMKKRMKILAAVLLLPLALCLSAGAAETDAQRERDEAALRSAVARRSAAVSCGHGRAGRCRLVRAAAPKRRAGCEKRVGKGGRSGRAAPGMMTTDSGGTRLCRSGRGSGERCGRPGRGARHFRCAAPGLFGRAVALPVGARRHQCVFRDAPAGPRGGALDGRQRRRSAHDASVRLHVRL